VVHSTHFSLDGSAGNGAYSGNYYPGFVNYQYAVLLPTTSATLSGSGTTLTLGAAAQTQLAIGYADTPDTAGSQGGPVYGGRYGNLRDSDPYKGLSGSANYNWCVEFYQNVA
jgi:hypothetical protein